MASRGSTSRQLYPGNSGQGSTPVPNPPVFSTPSQLEHHIEQSSNAASTPEDGSIETPTSNQMEALVTRYYYHQELDKAHDQMKREEHEKRLKSLRKELDWIASTQWMYSPVEKLIGQ